MKYIVYLTRNKESKFNGADRIYVGVHKTENPEVFDGYLGEGVKMQEASSFMRPKTPFQYAVKKYGTSAFERSILYTYDNKEEAYQRLHELLYNSITNAFYNVTLYNGGKPLYQFDLNGKLVKVWKSSEDCYDFYGYSATRFHTAIKNKCALLKSYWSNSNSINVEEYSIKNLSSIVHVYNKEGKLLQEFLNPATCAKHFKCKVSDINKAIAQQTLIDNMYYVSNKVVDEFKPKPRRQYLHKTFYVYKAEGEYIGTYVGKELMKVISLHSWRKISNIFSLRNGYYKDFYISLKPIAKIPEKESKKYFIIYDKYGNFIEQLDSITKVKEKYNVPSAKIKDIQQGAKCFGDYIFKYSK